MTTMMLSVRRARVVAVTALLFVSVVAIPVTRAQTPPKGGQAPAKKNPLLKLAEPWPDAAQRRQRRTAAESRPIFATTDPLAFTLAANFKALNKDHDPNSKKRYPGELKMTREDGKMDTIAVNLGARGHIRRMARVCEFVPIRVEFPKEDVKDTVFAGQNALKLVVPCQSGKDYEQYILREYLVYRVFNLLTARSFRARLARVTYVDSMGKTMATRPGILLEDDGDVATRMEGRTVALQRVLFENVDQETLTVMMVFEYMIGNTDYSLYALHNVRLVQLPETRLMYTVPYDFDLAGAVHPPYAIPDRRLGISSVTDRLYRGPCYFEGFYSTINNAKDVKRLFIDACSKPRPTM